MSAIIHTLENLLENYDMVMEYNLSKFVTGKNIAKSELTLLFLYGLWKGAIWNKKLHTAVMKS